MAASAAASEHNALHAELEELAVRYTLGDDPTKLLLRVPWKHGAISQDRIVDFLAADGVDPSRLKAIRVLDPSFDAWSLLRNTHPLDGCPTVGASARLLELKLDLFPPLPQPPMLSAATNQSSGTSAGGASADYSHPGHLEDRAIAAEMSRRSSEPFGLGQCCTGIPSHARMGGQCGGGYGGGYGLPGAPDGWPLPHGVYYPSGAGYGGYGGGGGGGGCYGGGGAAGYGLGYPYGNGQGYPLPPDARPPQSLRSHSGSTSDAGGASTPKPPSCSAQASAEWAGMAEPVLMAGSAGVAAGDTEGGASGAGVEAGSSSALARRRARFAKGEVGADRGGEADSGLVAGASSSLDTMQRLPSVGNGLGLPRMFPPPVATTLPQPARPASTVSPSQPARTGSPGARPRDTCGGAWATDRPSRVRHEASAGSGGFPPPAAGYPAPPGGKSFGGGVPAGHPLASHPLSRYLGGRYGDALEFALLHAAPLVWRKKKMVMPLDHQALSLDFKGELRALRDVLRRARKQVSMCSDVASSASLCEMLALKPSVLHLVCHGDVDEHGAFFLGFEDAEGSLDQLSLSRLHALLAPAGLVRGTGLVFVSACHSQPAAEVFAACGVPHVIGVRAQAKVLDDAAALFARHLYLALVQGNTVRASFQMGAAALAATAPSIRMPDPAEEASKFVLLPEAPARSGPASAITSGALGGLGGMGGSGLGGLGAAGRAHDRPADPHEVVLFHNLPPGEPIDRNPLPVLEPPYLQKPFLGRAIELRELVLTLGRKRQKEVRLVTLTGKPGVGKTNLAIAAAGHLYERRWFPDGCVCVELSGRPSQADALLALAEALDMELRSLSDVSRGLKSWRGLLVLDGVDDAAAGPLAGARPLIAKLLTTKELRVLCTARYPLELEGERVFEVQPLHPHDAARLFRDLAIEALPPELRNASALLQHPVLKGLGGMPRAICQAAPVLRQGATLADLEREMLPPPPPAAPPPPAVPVLAAAAAATHVSIATSPLFLPRFGAPGPPFGIGRQPAAAWQEGPGGVPQGAPVSAVPQGGPAGDVPQGCPAGGVDGPPPAIHQHTDPAAALPQLYASAKPPWMSRSRSASVPFGSSVGLGFAGGTEPGWGGAAPDSAAGMPNSARAASADAICGEGGQQAVLPRRDDPFSAPSRPVVPLPPQRLTVEPHGFVFDTGAGPLPLLEPFLRATDAPLEIVSAALVPLGAAVLLPDPMQEMVRKTLEMSLTLLRHTNAAAYTLLAVMTLLPGGALSMELDELWDVTDVGMSAVIAEACVVKDAKGECMCEGARTAGQDTEKDLPIPHWEGLMQVLVQQPGEASGPASQLAPANAEMRWLVRRRVLPVPPLPKQSDGDRTPRSARFMADSIDHYMSELNPTLHHLLPPRAMRRLACRCARHFAALGERVVALLQQENAALAQAAARLGGGEVGNAAQAESDREEATRWRKVMSDSLAPNMWACLSPDRLLLLKRLDSDDGGSDGSGQSATEADGGAALRRSSHVSHPGPCLVRPAGATEPCVRHTARVGEGLSRILSALGRVEEAAAAAKRTLEALEFLGVSADLLGDIKLLLGGQMLLRSEEPGALNMAQEMLQEAVLAFAEAPRGEGPPSPGGSSDTESAAATGKADMALHTTILGAGTSATGERDGGVQTGWGSEAGSSSARPSVRGSYATNDGDALGLWEGFGPEGPEPGGLIGGATGGAGRCSPSDVSLDASLGRADAPCSIGSTPPALRLPSAPPATRALVASSVEVVAGALSADGPAGLHSIDTSNPLALTWTAGLLAPAGPAIPRGGEVSGLGGSESALAQLGRIDLPAATLAASSAARLASTFTAGGGASGGQRRWRQAASMAVWSAKSRRQNSGLVKALIMLGDSYIQGKQREVDAAISASLLDPAAPPLPQLSPPLSPSPLAGELSPTARAAHEAHQTQLHHAEKYFREVVRRLPACLRGTLHPPGEESSCLDALISLSHQESCCSDVQSESDVWGGQPSLDLAPSRAATAGEDGGVHDASDATGSLPSASPSKMASACPSPALSPTRAPAGEALLASLGGMSPARMAGALPTPEEVEHWKKATAGLAWIALIRGEPKRAVSILGTADVDDPAVMELRGKARAALGELDEARELVHKAAELWQERGDGVRAQAALASLESLRRALLLRRHPGRPDAARLIVMHAAPLIVWQDAPADSAARAPPAAAGQRRPGMRIRPVAFSKRSGLRCWRHLRDSLVAIPRALRVQFEVATRASLASALNQPDQPMLHFLPAPDYMSGVSLEGSAGELLPLPVPELRVLLSSATSLPSLVLLSAGCSDEAGRAFLEAGVETVIAVRGWLPEAQVTAFCAAFYTALLEDGRQPRDAFAVAAAAAQRQRAGARLQAAAEPLAPAHGSDAAAPDPASVPSAPLAQGGGRFVLLGAASQAGPLPPPGEMVDVSPQQCPWNLDVRAAVPAGAPLADPAPAVSLSQSHSLQDLTPKAREVETAEPAGAAPPAPGVSPPRDPISGWHTAPLRRLSTAGISDGSQTAEPAPADAAASTSLVLVAPGPPNPSAGTGPPPLAHGIAFVGRHLELHQLLTSCLDKQLTYVHGAKGLGKSALVLEAATYLRQRGAFPHGIFVCSLEGLRKTDRVRAQLGATLNFPARSASELSAHLSRFNQCLLILDRCEAAISNSRTQFLYFLDQLLVAGVRLLVSSSSAAPIDLTELRRGEAEPTERRSRDEDDRGEDGRRWSADDADDGDNTEGSRRPPVSLGLVQLQPLSPRDAALLLLELCERPLDLDELTPLGGGSAGEEEVAADLLGTLRRHELIFRLGGLPPSIQWAARRLKDVTVNELVAELRALKPREQARLVKQASARGGAALAPPPPPHGAAGGGAGAGGLRGEGGEHSSSRRGHRRGAEMGDGPESGSPHGASGSQHRRQLEQRRRSEPAAGWQMASQALPIPQGGEVAAGQLSSIVADLLNVTNRLTQAAASHADPTTSRMIHSIQQALAHTGSRAPPPLGYRGGGATADEPGPNWGWQEPRFDPRRQGTGRRDAQRLQQQPTSRRSERKAWAAEAEAALYDHQNNYHGSEERHPEPGDGAP